MNFTKLKILKTTYLDLQVSGDVSLTLTFGKAQAFMTTDMMPSEPTHWMVFGQLVVAVQYCCHC